MMFLWALQMDLRRQGLMIVKIKDEKRMKRYEKALDDIILHMKHQKKKHVCWYCAQVAKDAK